ncbi:MAG: 3-dehydroquinate synthase [Candidatus Cloacimonadota bacterium]|jgi:3-dehydroquinate synthase|nr:3-dehydroquinate synthase [Candidatus Cloacimonadota bacterium]
MKKIWPNEIIFGNSTNFPKLGKIYVVDNKLHQLYPNKIEKITAEGAVLNIEVSEKNKNLQTLQKIFKFFLKHDVTREDMVVAIGGGILTDITALAASLFKRGCQLAFVPTTLLAMVDAAVGGKTAVNFTGYKNILGNFYPAHKIIIDLDFLDKLPESEFDNGYIEIKKIALLADSGLLEMIKEKAPLQALIEKAILTKKEFCLQDPNDMGERRFLNLGHTFAHLIETATNFNFPHGLAVAKGIMLAAAYSVFLGKLSQDEFNQISLLFEPYQLPNFPLLNFTEFKKIIRKDKKKGKEVNLILLESIYKPFLFPEANLKRLYNFIYQK